VISAIQSRTGNRAKFLLMIEEVAKRLGPVNVKAGTTEGMGWIGKGQGMAAMAVVLLEKKR
jgi:2C-methyl-D-erythritol 2,4-cyclodiphosphate synthase